MSKITELPLANPPAADDHFPIVQDGLTRRASFGAFATGLVPLLPEGFKGNPGVAGNVAATIYQLKAAAVGNDTMLFDAAMFKWTAGDFTGQADDQNVVKSDAKSLAEGAWVRQSAGKLTYRAFAEGRLRDLGDKVRSLGVYLDDFPGFDPAVDMAAVFVAAVAWCQANGGRVLHTGAHEIKIGSKVTLSGPPVAIVGEPSPNAGGAPPCDSGFAWIGGADDMFVLQSSGWMFSDLCFLNRGAGRSVFEMRAQRFVFNRVYLTSNGDNPSPWSGVMCRPYRNEGGYSVWRDVQVLGATPGVVHWSELSDGATGNGATTAFFFGGLVESTADGDVTILKMSGSATMDGAYFFGVNGNQQVGELCWVDTMDTTAPTAIGVLSLDGMCEIDNANDAVESGVADNRQLRLKNCPSVWINALELQGGGMQLAIGELVNSQVVVGSGKGNRIGGPVFRRGTGDTTSTVRVTGPFKLDPFNTAGWFDGTNILQIAPSGTIFVLPGYQLPGTLYHVILTAAESTLSLVHPGVGAGGAQTPGMPFDVMITNNSGGATTFAPAGGATYWMLQGRALPTPAHGKYIVLRLVWDNSVLKFRELSRSGEIG